MATPETILKEVKEHLPDLYNGLLRLRNALGTRKIEAELNEVYEDLDAVSFDYGIMEKTREKVYVLPCECAWSDVGSWASLYEIRSTEYDGAQNISDGETHLVDCEKSFVSALGGRPVACLGLKNCLVVDTPEVILVADLNRSQDIRKVVAQIKGKGREKLL